MQNASDDITSKLNKKGKEMYDFVEDYDRKIHRHELQVNTQKANDVLIDDFHSLAEALAYWMNQWRKDRTNPDNVAKTLGNVGAWVNRAYDYGCIDQGDGLIGKLDDCRREHIKTENELTLLSKKFTEIDEKNKNLESEVQRLNGLLYQKGIKP